MRLSLSRAQVSWLTPAETSTTEPGIPETVTGAVRSRTVPSPTSPLKLDPQHARVPSVLRAHAKRSPTETSAVAVPSAVTWTGVSRSTVVPSPTMPNSLSPQHHSVPSVLRAQAAALPVDTWATLLPRLITWPGVDRWPLVPSPRKPLPQHQSVPLPFRAQVKRSPADTSTTSVPIAVTWTGTKLSSVSPSPS